MIEISTNEGDIVLDPFCGSGTTLVAAKLKGRKYVGIDISQEAIDLTKSRLVALVKTESALLNRGRSSYINADEKSLAILTGLDILPVQRNAGIDAILKRNHHSKPVPIRVQREHETILEAATKLAAASEKKGAEIAFLVATKQTQELLDFSFMNCLVKVINSPALEINSILDEGVVGKSLNTDLLIRVA
jgi:site-specific DNA-methyltransferase (adenine-specific)